MNIIDFLEQRLAEDEKIAHEATRVGAANWDAKFYPSEDGDVHARTFRGFIAYGRETSVLGDYDTAAHIARHDPARVLREVAAKRAILAPHTRDDFYELNDETTGSCERCSSYCDEAGCRNVVRWPCGPLKALASIWSDHPSFEPDWA